MWLKECEYSLTKHFQEFNKTTEVAQNKIRMIACGLYFYTIGFK